jgi:hypothetical protein
MGRRDYRRHEAKKPKKDAKKASISEILPPPVTVEVIKKKRFKEPEEEE